jgi:hypothetical protein
VTRARVLLLALCILTLLTCACTDLDMDRSGWHNGQDAVNRIAATRSTEARIEIEATMTAEVER